MRRRHHFERGTLMRRLVTILSVFCLCAVMATSASAQNIYGWTVSRSDADPFANTGELVGSFVNLYLWYACNSNDGMSAAEIDPLINAPNSIAAFNVLNGYLNAGTATHLLLAVGGCPAAPVVAGSWLVLRSGPIDLCPSGANVTVDCSADPSAWPNEYIGYSELGVPCQDFTPCETSVEPTSWGRVKQLYRE
jgi:hypothetical protein